MDGREAGEEDRFGKLSRGVGFLRVDTGGGGIDDDDDEDGVEGAGIDTDSDKDDEEEEEEDMIVADRVV